MLQQQIHALLGVVHTLGIAWVCVLGTGSARSHGVVALQARKRSLGNIRFIGFLFVQKLLSEKIMHTCIQQLLQRVCPC